MNARQPETWTLDALCAQTDPEVFFPDRGQNPKAAKRICAQCPVAEICREIAVADPAITGVWGGTTHRERQQIRRERGLPSEQELERIARKANVRALLARGIGPPEIAESLGVAYQTIYRDIKEMEIAA